MPIATEDYCTPLTISNGDIAVTSYEIDATATYTCYLGYALENPALRVRTCVDYSQWDGRWDPKEDPVCNRT